MFVETKLDRFHALFWCAMVRVAKRAIKLAFDDIFFTLSFDHIGFNAFTACSFLTTHQNYRFSVFKIEEICAERAFEI
jgi:hypothetical protein